MVSQLFECEVPVLAMCLELNYLKNVQRINIATPTHALTDTKHLLKLTKFNEIVKKTNKFYATVCHIRSFMKSYEDQN